MMVFWQCVQQIAQKKFPERARKAICLLNTFLGRQSSRCEDNNFSPGKDLMVSLIFNFVDLVSGKWLSLAATGRGQRFLLDSFFRN